MNENVLKNTAIVCAVLVLITVPIVFKMGMDAEAKRLYKQGMEYYNKQDYSNAYYNFKSIKRFSNIYSLALLKQFQCAKNLQDTKTARQALKESIRIIKDDNIRPFLLYSDAIMTQELNLENDEKLMARYKYIIEHYEENDFSYASSYRFAKLAEKQNKYLAKEKYIEYLSYAPNGKYSVDALESLKENEDIFTKEDMEIIADAYLSNNNFSTALSYFEKSDFGKNWIKISKCQKNLKRFDDEMKTIKNGFNLKNSTPEEKEISYAIERYIVLSRSDRVQALRELYTLYPNSYLIPTIEYKLAESTTSEGAIKFYEDLAQNHSDSMWTSNALWELIWYNYKQKRYKTCEKLYQLYFDEHKDAIDAPRITYWYGKALLNIGRTQKAREVFNKTMNDYPLSFYAFLSARQLKIAKSKRLISNKPISHYNINSINKDLFKNSTLLLLADYDDWQTMEDLKINNEYIKSWILNKKGQYPLSINIAKNEYEKSDVSSFDDWQLKLMYPVVFEEIINEKSKLYERSPYLFLSLVREESHFNPEARSSVGALGLSQIMPATANFITKSQISRAELLNEEKNIDIGLKYYTYLTEYFKGNEFLAIMSYNAGPGNINRWLKNPITDTGEIDMFIENVPFLETKNYIKKILSTYWVYMNVYSNRYI